MKRIVAIVLVTVSIAASALSATASQLPQLAGYGLSGRFLAENIIRPGHDAVTLGGYTIGGQPVAENIQKPGHEAVALTGYGLSG